MTHLVDNMVLGLTIGAIYGLVAIGLSILWSSTDVINLAQGDFVMLGGYLAFTLMVTLSQNFIVALLVMVLLMVLGGSIFFKLVISRCARPDMTLGAIIIATLGISYFLRGSVPLVWGTTPLRVPSPLENASVALLGQRIPAQYLLMIGVGVLIAGVLHLVFKKTLIGLALRATAEDREMAGAMGINTMMTSLAATAACVALASIAGFIIAPMLFANIYMGLNIMFKAYVAAMLGGIGNHLMVFLGALIVGVIEILVASYVYPGYADITIFFILLVVILTRPRGLWAH